MKRASKSSIDKEYSDLLNAARKQPGIKEFMEVSRRYDEIMKKTRKYSNKPKFFFSVSSSTS